MEFVRLFTAIVPGPQSRSLITRVSAELAEILPDDAIRWVPESNLHVTLHFLGNVATGTEDTVRQATAEGVARSGVNEPLTLETGLPGAFPNLRRPRVIWLGVEDTSGGLRRLHKALADELVRRDIGFDSKPLRPHITLGYVRKSARSDVLRRISESLQLWSGSSGGARPESHRFETREVVLVRSVLTPGGAVYSADYSVPLDARNEISSGESALE